MVRPQIDERHSPAKAFTASGRLGFTPQPFLELQEQGTADRISTPSHIHATV